MTLGQWLPLWLRSYKLGTIKGTSYHQLEILCQHIPENLKETELSDILLLLSILTVLFCRIYHFQL